MTVNAWLGPLGPPVAMTTSLAYQMVKDMGQSVAFRTVPNTSFSSVPKEYANHIRPLGNGVCSISGLFYTHTRFKHLQTRFRMEQSIGVQMPWQMRFIVATLDLTRIRGIVLNELRAMKVNPRQIYSSQEAIRKYTPQLQAIDRRLNDMAATRQGQPRSATDFNSYMVEAELRDQRLAIQTEIISAQHVIDLARNYAEREEQAQRDLAQLEGQNFISNFTFSFMPEYRGLKWRSSTGIKGTGEVKIGEYPGQMLSVELHWHEDHFVGKGHDWIGNINVSCDATGTPHLSGQGPFWDRYVEYHDKQF